MRNRRPTFLTTCLLAVAMVTACQADHSSPQPPAPALPTAVGAPPVVLAFMQSDRMRFADASGRVWGGIVTSSTPRSAVWSADGHHFAWLDDSRLHVVDASTGMDHPRPCPCRGLDRLGDGFASISADGRALLLFDPATGPARIPLHRQMPYASVAAGGRDQVAVAEPIPEERAVYRGQSTLLAIGRDGKSRRLMAGDSAVSMAGGVTSPDGTRIATIESPSSGACWTTPGVLTLRDSGLNPQQTRLVPRDAPFAKAVLTEVRDITAMSWAGDGLMVTFGPNYACQSTHPDRYLTYHLAGTQWRFLRSGVLGAGFGADGRSYGIELPNSISSSKSPSASGQLVLTTTGGTRTVLGSDVTAFWLTPAEQSTGRPQPGSAPDLAITTTDQGKPIPPAVLSLLHQITTALDNNDTTTLTRLCSPCDTGTHALLSSQAGRDDLRQSLRTHPAADDHSATFPGLALKQCFDAHAVEAACTIEQIRDIGTLQLRPTDRISQIDDPGQRFQASTKGSVRFVLDGTGAAHWAGQSTSAQNYLNRASYKNAEESYFFTSPDGRYICGFNSTMAACQGSVGSVPRSFTCGQGSSVVNSMYVDATGKANFLCAGGVIFYPTNREPDSQDRLAPGQVIVALGFTCMAERSGIRCNSDAFGHGFYIAPKESKRF